MSGFPGNNSRRIAAYRNGIQRATPERRQTMEEASPSPPRRTPQPRQYHIPPPQRISIREDIAARTAMDEAGEPIQLRDGREIWPDATARAYIPGLTLPCSGRQLEEGRRMAHAIKNALIARVGTDLASLRMILERERAYTRGSSTRDNYYNDYAQAFEHRQDDVEAMIEHYVSLMHWNHDI
ncbi:ORF4 [Birch leaf roll-associated virus]|uniref:ORF4 n=1 Tax=Birch leaf roll-associated virus TaxID=2057979 RepID=A0A2L0W0N8_9VIRU|nr:ORF4 [Birch leaf roll-associated virus]